jgi:hypothetical protein
MEELNGHKAFFVDGNPFIILGLQWDCDGCYTKADMDPLFAECEKMGLNTASLLLYWNEIEPIEGEYHFEMLDHRLEMARRHHLKIVLVWFASFKNSVMTYAPDYVRQDHKRFRKVRDRYGLTITNSCCPKSEETRRRDEAALIQVFKHLKEVDSKDHTVILFQMENETGIYLSDRCYCDVCNEAYEKGAYDSRYGVHAAESFTAQSILEYCDSLAKTVKGIYPLPVYMNAALAVAITNHKPGLESFSGGPDVKVLDIYLDGKKYIDFIAPDIYQFSYRDFHYYCREYSKKANPLFIAECATGKGTRVEKNAFYAIGTYGAIGFDPWSVTRAFPDFMSEPLVTLSSLKWSDEAYELQKSYKLISGTMVPIAEAQLTDRLATFVQEEGEGGTLLKFGDVDIEIRYAEPKNGARGIVIRRSKNEFIILALGVFVQFSRDGGEHVPVAKIESGHFEGRFWVKEFTHASERMPDTPFSIADARVVRAVLGDRIDYPDLKAGK